MVLATLAVAMAPACADDPLYGIDESVQSRQVVITTVSNADPLTVPALLEDFVRSGPYNRGISGFADETISQGISEGGKPIDVFSVSIFQSAAAADKATDLRKSALSAAPGRDQGYIKAAVIEHLVANWGWERGKEVKFIRLEPGKPTKVYDEYNSTLSFFKSGYTGQMSMLEFFQPSATLEGVRAELTARVGMSGASIYRDEATGNFIAYSEYFNTASALKNRSASLVADRRMGQVTQNYRAR
jgi:hypothetical protein